MDSDEQTASRAGTRRVEIRQKPIRGESEEAGSGRPVRVLGGAEEGRVRAQPRAQRRGSRVLQGHEEAGLEAVPEVISGCAPEIGPVVLAQLLESVRAAVVAVFGNPGAEVRVQPPGSPVA